MRIFLRIMIAIVFISVVLYINLDKYYFEKNLFESSINSKIMHVEYKGRGGYIYSYKNGSFSGDYFSMFKRTQFLKIGDSISKPSKSWNLKTFKKDKRGKYVFYREFKKED